MTDFYAELNLDRGKTAAEISAELNRLEGAWVQRQIVNPEKATTMLALIIQARKVFATDASRRTYDDELERSRRQPEQVDPNKERSEARYKWEEQARSYYASGQYDLAKVALEKALSFSNVNEDDDALFALASDIYRANGDLRTAMNYINKAIVAVPDASIYYLVKAVVYSWQASEAERHNNYNEAAGLRAEACKTAQLADAMAQRSGNLADRARAHGLLAYLYYFQHPVDKAKGEEYANLTLTLGGDPWDNASKVFKAMETAREEARKREIETENARKEDIYNSAKRLAGSEDISRLEEAITKFKSIPGYKDSAQQIEAVSRRIREVTEKKRQAEARKRKCAWYEKLCMLSGAAFVLYNFVIYFLLLSNPTFRIKISLPAILYIFLLCAWSYLRGLHDYDTWAVVVITTILVLITSSGIGAVIMINRRYNHFSNGVFADMVLDWLGASDFFVIKFIGVSILASLAAVLILGKMGRTAGKDLRAS